LKKPFTEKSWWSGSRCRPWVQAPALQKKKKISVVIDNVSIAHTHYFVQCLRIGKDDQNEAVKHQ
jgi:hypothetical protein